MSGLPLITLPDFETLIIDRLFLCCQEIPGLSVFRLPPVIALTPEVFPICYPLVGPMTTAVPVESVGSGVITRTRDYVIRVLGDPVPETFEDSARGGSTGLSNLLPYFNALYSYFVGHPKLQTTTLDALRYMNRQMLISDGGFAQGEAPGGTMHFTINLVLTITMKAQVTTLA